MDFCSVLDRLGKILHPTLKTKAWAGGRLETATGMDSSVKEISSGKVPRVLEYGLTVLRLAKCLAVRVADQQGVIANLVTVD